MQNIELLLERFADDRESLADDELEALVTTLGADAQLAARLKDQLVIDELLGQQLAIDRRNFAAQVRQRIRDEESPPEATAGVSADEAIDEALAQDLRKLAGVEFEVRQHSQQRERRSRALLLSACALLLAAAAGAWWWQQSQMALAVVTAVAGEPSLVGSGQPQAAKVGAVIRQGDRLVTRPGETLSIKFTDGSTLELLGDTSLQLRGGRGTAAKDIAVDWGSISADIRPQPTGAPLSLETSLAIATVYGTRLRLAADSSRTRLDVLEGIVRLVRKSDEARVEVKAQEFAVASAGELSVTPLAWPVDRRDAIVILETGDPATPSLVRHAVSRQLRTVKLEPRGRARQNHDFAWVVGGGAYFVPDAGRALRTACRATGELTIEATITPAHLQQSGPARIIACSQDSHAYNFMLGQEENRLIFRLLTSDADWRSEDLEVGRVSAGAPQHVAVCYRPGELACYINGRRVYYDAKLHGNLQGWKPHELLLGDDAAAERNWAGTLEGIAIYDRFLDEEEVARNAEQYRVLLARRPTVPQVELSATLVARSAIPEAAAIAPQRAALVMCRYRVDEVLRGELLEQEVLVAQWAVLDGELQPPATMKIGLRRHMTIERLGLNPQLAGVPRSDDFHEGDDPERARYYDVSDP